MGSFVVFVMLILHEMLLSCMVGLEECPDNEYANYPQILLPRLDLNLYTNGTVEDKIEIISLFNKYAHELGAFSVYNHGIPITVLNDMKKFGINFFKKDIEYKNRFRSIGLGRSGYKPFKSLAVSSSYGEKDNNGDYTEMFAMFNHVAGNTNKNDFYPLKNDTPAELYNISRIYINYINNVLNIIHSIASEALLGINNSDWFTNIYSETPLFHLRWLYYPIMNNTEHLIKSNKFRISQHKDYLAVTLIRPGNVRGLQYKIGGKDGIWMDCKTNEQFENDIIINIGELFDFWTNGYWISPWHRVIFDKKERITFTYFTAPNYNFVVKPIENCLVCTKEKQIYAQRTVLQHQQLRYSKINIAKNSKGLKFFSD